MPELSLDQQVEQMITPSSQRMSALAAELRGVGADAVVEYNRLRKTLADLPGIGQTAANAIAELRNDVTSGHLPLDHRRRLERETRDGAEVVLKKMNAAAHQTVPRIKALLEDGLLPSAARVDPGVRSLRRQEVQAAMAAQPSGSALDRARSVLGRSAAWDSELLSDFGRALVGDDWSAVRAEAVGKWTLRSDGTERQVNSRKALAAFGRANLKGAVAAHEAAARAHLTRDDRLPVRRPS
jgi:hypothetical protein